MAKTESRKPSVIGVIPQYPSHSKQNIYAKIKMPPVGIVSILSQIDDDPRFGEVYAIDENNYIGPRDFTGMPDHGFLQARSPAGVAMLYGGMSNSVPRLFSVARQYKNFGAVTIAGGSHVDALPRDALSSGVDIVVHGEGEHTSREILENIATEKGIVLDRQRLSQVKGISILDENGKYLFTGQREPITNIDELKDPDLTLIRFHNRWSAIPINRGRGCNWKCEFCVVNKQYGAYKSRSNEKTLRQIVRYSDMGYKDFFFTDDNFAQDPEETIELCKMIGDYKKRFGKKLALTVQVRNEVAENDRLIEAMKFAGVRTLAIGYESPINEELRAMKKGVTVEKLVQRSRKLAEHFWLHGMFIFGYPTFKDSQHKSNMTLEEKAKRYTRFFKDSKIDTVQVLNAVPLPGSELRAKLEAEGRLLPQEMVGFERYDGQHLCYDPRQEGIDPYDLQNVPRALMKKWYLGGFLNRGINPGRWMNWVYNAVGFPVQFGAFYAKRFVHNLVEEKRGRNIAKEDSLMPKRNIFHESLVNTMGDIQRSWRNLFIRTYGGGIVKRWLEEYRKSDYESKLRHFFSRGAKKG